MKKMLKVVSVIALILAGLLLVISLFQDVLLGWHPYFDAANVVSDENITITDALIAECRNVALPPLLLYYFSMITLLFVGILGLRYSKRMEKPALPIIFAIINLIAWIGYIIVDAKLDSLLLRYHIPSDSKVILLFIFIPLLILYVLGVLLAKRKENK